MNEIKNPFQGRSLLAMKDFTADEINYLVDFGEHLKYMKKHGIPHHYLEGKNIALLFEKTSTRTRSSFVVASHDLGASAEFMSPADMQLGNKESIEDTAIVLGNFFDGIEYRGFAQADVEELADKAGVPVWNGLSDKWHPTQMIADFMTIKEKFGHLKGIDLTYVGDGRNNMANSLLVAGSIVGINVRLLTPKSLFPADDVVELAKKACEKSGAKFTITDDLEEGVKGTNVIYGDVWVSMGENNWADRIKLLKPYQINMDMFKLAGMPDDEIIFMDCLPAFHDTNTKYGKEMKEKYGLDEMEVTDEVFRSKYAWQFEEAENRMHSIKAIMAATLGDLFIPTVHVDYEK